MKQIIFRNSVQVKSKTYSTRTHCEEKIAKDCYVYSMGNNGTIEFGSVERIFVQHDGKTYLLIQKFETENPFSKLFGWAENHPRFHCVMREFDTFNTFFRKIVGTTYKIASTSSLEGYISLLETNGNSYFSRF